MQTELVGHWPLGPDTKDHSRFSHATKAVDVGVGETGPNGKTNSAARFNGKTSLLEIADHPELRFGDGDFTVSAWISIEADVVGNILSKFDETKRQGYHFYVLTSSGVTSAATANYRQLQFGIDEDRLEPEWRDCGRPGNAVQITALTSFNGQLYAGTTEIGAQERGRLWLYRGDGQWQDWGNPVGCNTVHSVAEHNGSLYVGTARYNCSGSRLGETLNKIPGGKVYRVEPGGDWTDCGHPGHEDATPDSVQIESFETGKADDAMALTSFHGDLYCTSNHRRGVFRYLGGTEWQRIGLPHRVITLAIHRGKLYALLNAGPVYRYEGGTDWADCGCPQGSTQTYSAAIHRGRFYVGTWPNGAVHVYEGDKSWRVIGYDKKVAFEREIMAMINYNGKLYLGSLPMANVYRMDGERFTMVGNLDNSPVELRRVWSMAVHQGQLFAGTLPSGHIRSLRAGSMTTHDWALPGGWNHVAARRAGNELSLFHNGKLVATSSASFTRLDVKNETPLTVGFGMYEHFDGLMSDVRLHRGALSEEQVRQLAT